MAKTVNKYYQKVAETPDASLKLGEVNDDGVISAFQVVANSDAAGAIPHYFQMDRTGDAKDKGRQGGTIFSGGGSFQVVHGEYVAKGIPGVYIDSGSGDLVLASGGRIRIYAENIELIATGSGDNGNVQINGNGKVLISSKDTMTLEANKEMNLKCHKKLRIHGSTALKLVGGMIEAVDGATTIKGSTGILPGLGTLEEIRNTLESIL